MCSGETAKGLTNWPARHGLWPKPVKGNFLCHTHGCCLESGLVITGKSQAPNRPVTLCGRVPRTKAQIGNTDVFISSNILGMNIKRLSYTPVTCEFQSFIKFLKSVFSGRQCAMIDHIERPLSHMRLRFIGFILRVLATKQSGRHLARTELEGYLLMKKRAALFHPKLWEESLYTEKHDFFFK